MATGRVLVVHASAPTRTLLVDLLAADGWRAEAVGSTIQAITRFVDEPAELVVVGLGQLESTELELIRTLKAESDPPRVLVCFPSPKRDLAVKALRAGADAYLLEPFYAAEVSSLVAAQRAAPVDHVAPADMLAEFAHEVAHAINNPLQVILLLLGKEKVTKKELMDHIPENVERINRAVSLLKSYAAMPKAEPMPGNPHPAVERIALERGVAFTVDGEMGDAMLDDRAWAATVDALFDAVRPASARLDTGPDQITLTLGGGAVDVPDTILFVTPEREIRSGLLLARTLLERQGGSLGVQGDAVIVRLKRA